MSGFRLATLGTAALNAVAAYMALTAHLPHDGRWYDWLRRVAVAALVANIWPVVQSGIRWKVPIYVLAGVAAHLFESTQMRKDQWLWADRLVSVYFVGAALFFLWLTLRGNIPANRSSRLAFIPGEGVHR